MPRITYSIADLLALSVFASRVEISEEQKKRFSIIESEAPPKRSHEGKSERNQREGRKEERNEKNHANRFEPPPRRGGNRNHETFDEGVRYELERNAEHQKRIQETLNREAEKMRHLRNNTEQNKAPSDHSGNKDELENLMSTIAETTAQPPQRSRFFNEESENNHKSDTGSNAGNPNNKNMDSATNKPVNQWKHSDLAMWRANAGLAPTTGSSGPENNNNQKANNNNNGNNNNNNNHTNVTQNLPQGMQFNNNTVFPPNYGVASNPTVPPTGQPINLFQLQASVPQSSTPAVPTGQSVNLADLEQMLFRNKAQSGGTAPRANTNTGDGGKVTSVSDIEAMLKKAAAAQSPQNPAQNWAKQPPPNLQTMPPQYGTNPMMMPNNNNNNNNINNNNNNNNNGGQAPYMVPPQHQPMMFSYLPQMNNGMPQQVQFMPPPMNSQQLNAFGTNPQMMQQIQQMRMQFQQQQQQQPLHSQQMQHPR